MTEHGSLAEAVSRSFESGGALAQADARYVERAEQMALAQAIAEAIETRGALVAEAGTGIGKTFAYLVPLLLAGRRALVSTATKSLQDQLFLRDLPRLCSALGVPARRALLKGRASYLCLYRLEQARTSAHLPDRFAVRALARIEEWAPSTRTGDLAELPTLDERSPVIPLVTSTRDNCLGTECPRFRDCHVMSARREAMAADVVVVNHHLFFADMALRDSGVAELLPTVDVAIFDEAHQLVDTGVQFLGRTLGSAQVIDFTRDLLAAGLQKARGLQPWAELAAACDRAARDLRLASGGALREVRGALKLRWAERSTHDGFQAALSALAAASRDAAAALDTVSEIAPDFSKLQERALQFETLAHGFVAECEPERVRWIDLSPQQVRLVESPLDICDMLGSQRQAAQRAWIFTSATLGDDESLRWFTQRAGLQDAHTIKAGSPFDYGANARLWVPSKFPKPNDASHPAAVGALAARCAQALGGRTFVLTTTLRAMHAIADALREHLADDDDPIVVLLQGSAPKRTLLQQFESRPRSVLVGSQTFWEGIDVPGDALQCVVIDKLPFPPPNDPLVEARVRQIESRGGNAFNDYFVAEAAVSLKQGAGRLIRTETDRGLLVVCDPRLVQMGYGGRLRAALPTMPMLREENEALDWLRDLAAAH